MLNPLKSLSSALPEVYHRRSYYFVTVFFALFTFTLNGVIHNLSLLFSDFSFRLVYYLVLGWVRNLPASALILIIFVSLIGGVVFSMSIYLLRRQLKSGVGGSLAGIFATLIAPACPSCAFSFFAVLGVGGVLSFLPFKGMELGVIAVLILLLSLWYISNKINTKICIIKNE